MKMDCILTNPEESGGDETPLRLALSNEAVQVNAHTNGYIAEMQGLAEFLEVA